MRPSAILGSFSLLIPARPLASRAVVAPLPLKSSFDHQLTVELHTLQLQNGSDADHTSASTLLHALHASITVQNIILKSLVNVMRRDSDHKVIDKYLEDTVELLDACNGLLEKMEIIHNYNDSLRIVSHLLEGRSEPNPTTWARARDVLESCGEMEKCGSGLRKLKQKLAKCTSNGSTKVGWEESELSEILSGSKAVALMVCKVLDMALSFKSKRSGSVMLTELRQTVMAARELRNLMKCKKQNDEHGVNVEELRRRCGELEEGIQPIEGRVKELYRHLISVRMALLGILSHA